MDGIHPAFFGPGDNGKTASGSTPGLPGKEVEVKRLATAAVVLLIWSGAATAADFNGNGVNDIGIFRPSTGLWAIRNVTRVYFGSSGDTPMPGDYNGDGTVDIAVFRPSTGLWAVRGVTRTYFGSSGDTPLIGIPGGGGGFQPVAHGMIYHLSGPTPVILWGSDNFSVTWTVFNTYDIQITGHFYTMNFYMTMVTPLNVTPIISTISEGGGGMLQIRNFDLSGTGVMTPFQFVVYRKR